MHLPRSTYYDAPPVKADDAEIVAAITAICRLSAGWRIRRRTFLELTAIPWWRSSGPDLPGSRPRQDRRWPEPALGGGHHIHRDRNGLRLSGGNS